MLAKVEKVATDLFSGRPSLGLSHGRARQNARFRRILGNDGSDPGEPVTCGQWLADDRRRILLADIGVGTIDQALLAVLPTRFNTLQLWALSNRMLIVDEAHGYDPYMEEELRSLLRFVERVDAETAMERIREAVERGAACVWIRNAVDDAIATVQALEGRGIPADLLHARFTVVDRLRKEEDLQARFGRDETESRSGVLVATQVAEASLDLDFDVMISDLAPIGSLIQRAGRLWRHMDLRPADSRPVRDPALHVLSPDPESVEDGRWLHRVLAAGAWVYSLTDQWRTVRTVFRAGAIRAPDGLRDLIEAVHGPDAEEVPEALSRAEQDSLGKEMIERQIARNQLLSTHREGRPLGYLSAAQKVWDEERLTTRLGVPQVTLRLAQVGASGLVPLADSWEGSEVQMSRARYEKLGGVDQEAPEIVRLKASWPRLETTRSSRISSITPAGRSFGGKGAGIDDPATHDADGVHEGYSVWILPGLVGGLVDQAAHGVVGEHEPVDLLVDEVGRLAAQGGAGPEDVGLDLVVGGLDLPPLVIQRGAVVEKGGKGGEQRSLQPRSSSSPKKRLTDELSIKACVKTITGPGTSLSPLHQRRTVRPLETLKSRAAPFALRPSFRWASCNSSPVIRRIASRSQRLRPSAPRPQAQERGRC